MKKIPIAILGAGNIGASIAIGLAKSKQFQTDSITLTRRKIHLLDDLVKKGFKVQRDNIDAVRNSEIIIIAVEPQQLDNLLMEIRSELSVKKHILISLVSGVRINQIQSVIGQSIPIVRAMPNTAIAIGESMTCLVPDSSNEKVLQTAVSIFQTVGKTLVIDEEQMIAATALGACGIAFFLRAIRAASQGGIEIGFHYHEALMIAAQTAKGAASLLLDKENHPEHEIDKVTTPRGCTISGLNQMEHEGFSSAMIKGITTSADKASKLYTKK